MSSGLEARHPEEAVERASRRTRGRQALGTGVQPPRTSHPRREPKPHDLSSRPALPARQGHHPLSQARQRRRQRRALRRARDRRRHARGDPASRRTGDDRHQPSAAPRPSRPARQDSRRSGSHGERQVRRLRSPEECQHRRRRRPADVPGHRHGDRHGQEGRARLHRRRRRKRARRGHPRRLREEESALFAAGAALHVRGAQHQDQPAGADRNLCGRQGRAAGRFLQIPVRRQRRRLGQQDVPLSRHAGAA